MACFFIPILCGFRDIYPWADPHKFQLEDYAHKSQYFEFSFFISRAVFYLVAWMLSGYFLSRSRTIKAKLSAFGLCFLGLSVTMAGIDWQMSLDPEWFSTMYGFIFIIGQALGAWAFTLLILRLLLPELPGISLPTNRVGFRKFITHYCHIVGLCFLHAISDHLVGRSSR